MRGTRSTAAPGRRRGGVIAALAIALGLAMTGEARAQRGIDVETFRPALDGFGLFATERAETSGKYDAGFKLFVDYARTPLRLAMRQSSSEAQGSVPLRTVMEWQVVTHVGMHFGLTSWLELALDLPLSA